MKRILSVFLVLAVSATLVFNAAVGVFSFDGTGNLTASFTAVANGKVITIWA
jgi:hypothetical protein